MTLFQIQDISLRLMERNNSKNCEWVGFWKEVILACMSVILAFIWRCGRKLRKSHEDYSRQSGQDSEYVYRE